MLQPNPIIRLDVSRCKGVKDDAPLYISGTELGAVLQHLRPRGGLRELIADSLDDRGLYKLLVNQGRHLKILKLNNAAGLTCDAFTRLAPPPSPPHSASSRPPTVPGHLAGGLRRHDVSSGGWVGGGLIR